MKKTSIFINSNLSYDSVQAQDRDGRVFALYLDKNKYCIFSYASTNNIDQRIKEDKGINIIMIKNNFTRFLKSFYLLLFKKIDIYFSGKMFFYDYLLLIIFKKKTKFVFFLVNQIPYLWNKYDLMIFEKIINNKVYIFSISQQISESFLEYYNIQTPVINLIYDTYLIDTQKRQVPSLNNKKRKIVCVGSQIAHKNPFLFANIAKIFPEHDFVWIGNGYYHKWLLQKKSKENIDNFILIKNLIQSDLFPFLKNCDIFLFPSIHEGFPNVIIEALLCGLPVICFDYYGPEAIINNFNGFAVSSEIEMIEKLSVLINNKPLLDLYKSNARQTGLNYDGKIKINELEFFLDNTVIYE